MTDRNLWWIRETNHGCDNAYRSPMDQNGRWDELVLVRTVETKINAMTFGIAAYERFCDAGTHIHPPFAELPEVTKTAFIVAACYMASICEQRMAPTETAMRGYEAWCNAHPAKYHPFKPYHELPEEDNVAWHHVAGHVAGLVFKLRQK